MVAHWSCWSTGAQLDFRLVGAIGRSDRYAAAIRLQPRSRGSDHCCESNLLLLGPLAVEGEPFWTRGRGTDHWDQLFVAGYMLGPLLWGPLSEIVGRRPVFIVTFIAYIGFQVGCALAPNTAAILVFRFLGGTFAAAPLTNVSYPGRSDGRSRGKGPANQESVVWRDHCGYLGRGPPRSSHVPLCPRAIRRTSFWTHCRRIHLSFWYRESSLALAHVNIATSLASGNGMTLTTQSWRWVFWVTTIFASVCLLLIIFAIPETYAPALLVRKAQRVRQETGDDRYYAPAEKTSRNMREFLNAILLKPFIMLGTCFTLGSYSPVPQVCQVKRMRRGCSRL